MYLATLLLVMLREAAPERTYAMDVETVRNCVGAEYERLESRYENIRFVKINRTTKALSYEIDFKRPFDENVGTSLELAKWTSAGWTTLPFLPVVPNACEVYLRSFRSTFLRYASHMNLERPDKCPWPAQQRYVMKNFIFNFDSGFNFPLAGRFRTRVKTIEMRGKRLTSCMETIASMRETVN